MRKTAWIRTASMARSPQKTDGAQVACHAAFSPCTHGARTVQYGGSAVRAWRERGTGILQIQACAAVWHNQT